MTKIHDWAEGEFEVLSAGLQQADGQQQEFRVRGTVNTFKIMRSGRMFHPQAFDRYLSENAGKVRLPLLGNHGGVPGFATIGTVDKLEVKGGKLVFEATIASGTQLADEARQLIAQKHLTGISPGWASMQHFWVKTDDADIDPVVAKELKRTKRQGAWVFFDAEPVEISLVDVPDDGNARLAAQAAPPLQAGEAPALSAAQFETLHATFNEFLSGLRTRFEADANEVLETLLTDHALAYGHALLDGDLDAGEAGECPAHGAREGHRGSASDSQATGGATGRDNMSAAQVRLRRLLERRAE
ncbi:MAG: hypothetical protein SF069_02995 [Phycisphaerae bacterium]|nr:hypothetical protein [Phycisphaerae bacterium]